MYRIELAPGEETALRTIEELAIGIRNGVITPRARIWHGASQKWLPIEFHPHYRTALQQIEAEPLAAGEQHQSVAVMPVPPAAEPRSGEADPGAAPANDRRPGLRSLGLLAGGLVLIASAQMAASATAADDAPESVAQVTAIVPHRSASLPADSASTTAAPPPIDTVPAAGVSSGATAPAHDRPTSVPGGGVVSWPVASPPPPLPLPPQPTGTEDTLPVIVPASVPAPAIDALPLPSIPLDTLN